MAMRERSDVVVALQQGVVAVLGLLAACGGGTKATAGGPDLAMPATAMAPEGAPCSHVFGVLEVAALVETINLLPDGAVVCLEPGVYPVNLHLWRSITLRGQDRAGVVLDGGGEDPVIEVIGRRAEIAIERLTLRNGRGAGSDGGDLDVFLARRVMVRDVVLEDGAAWSGGAAAVHDGMVTFERCELRHNHGRGAQAVWADEGGHASLSECLLDENSGPGPAVEAAAPGEIALRHTTIITTGAARRAPGPVAGGGAEGAGGGRDNVGG